LEPLDELLKVAKKVQETDNRSPTPEVILDQEQATAENPIYFGSGSFLQNEEFMNGADDTQALLSADMAQRGRKSYEANGPGGGTRQNVYDNFDFMRENYDYKDNMVQNIKVHRAYNHCFSSSQDLKALN
jgi:hypothetical protein